MHIEPGLVAGAKIVLSYATAGAAGAAALKAAWDSVRHEGGLAPFIARASISAALVFAFFEILPHFPVGVSEVHLILGTTLFLIFGLGPAACGLALGLLVQGLFFEPADLPQYGMNVTTLLAPLFAMSWLAKRLIPQNCPYQNVGYGQALALSCAYQAGIVAWVAFWAFYGEGVSAATLANVGSFGLAYMSVILLEPLIDVGVLAIAKFWPKLARIKLFHSRLYKGA